MDINTIDLRVVELSLMKFQFHHNVFMEETRILRALRQLRMMEELDREEHRTRYALLSTPRIELPFAQAPSFNNTAYI